MIKRTDLSRVHLMPFFQTMTNVSTHLHTENLADLELKTMAETTFFPALLGMDGALKQIRVSGLTESILQMDTQRDLMVICLGEHLATFTHHPDDDLAEAATRLLLTFQKYGKGIQNLANPAETGVITNLLQDYSIIEAVTDLAKISATAWVDAIRDANGRFQEFSDERTRREARYEVGKARDARIALQEAFNALSKTTNALITLKGAQKYERLVANINTEIDAALQVVKQRTTAAKNQKDRGHNSAKI